jgi:hypothetical protein
MIVSMVLCSLLHGLYVFYIQPFCSQGFTLAPQCFYFASLLMGPCFLNNFCCFVFIMSGLVKINMDFQFVIFFVLCKLM